MLYEAMGAIDPTTAQPRGYLRLSANVRPDSVLFTLDIRPDGSWRQAEAFIQTTAPQLVQVRGVFVGLVLGVCLLHEHVTRMLHWLHGCWGCCTGHGAGARYTTGPR